MKKISNITVFFIGCIIGLLIMFSSDIIQKIKLNRKLDFSTNYVNFGEDGSNDCFINRAVSSVNDVIVQSWTPSGKFAISVKSLEFIDEDLDRQMLYPILTSENNFNGILDGEIFKGIQIKGGVGNKIIQKEQNFKISKNKIYIASHDSSNFISERIGNTIYLRYKDNVDLKYDKMYEITDRNSCGI